MLNIVNGATFAHTLHERSNTPRKYLPQLTRTRAPNMLRWLVASESLLPSHRCADGSHTSRSDRRTQDVGHRSKRVRAAPTLKHGGVSSDPRGAPPIGDACCPMKLYAFACICRSRT